MSEARLNTEFGLVIINSVNRWGWRDDGPETITISTELAENEVTVKSPRVLDDDDRVIEPASIDMSWPHTENGDQLDELVVLLQFGKQLINLIDAHNEDAIAEAVQKQEEAEAAKAQREEEAERITKEREETLLMELVGEHVKIRHSGYKSATEAVVEAAEDNRPEHEGEYFPRLGPWKHHDGIYSRGRRNVATWRRLDVKTAKGWRTVWDDGKDDLPEYDRGKDAPRYQPYGG
jgi:hypothetical protein